MKKSKKAFSLIEIIIACSILTIWVFWVYKLISGNMLLFSNSDSKKSQIIIEQPLKECLKNIWYKKLNYYSVWNNFSINFWNDNMWCFTWSFNTWYTFSWVNIWWIKYFLYWNVKEKDSEKITLDLNIYWESIWELYASWSQNKIIDIYK